MSGREPSGLLADRLLAPINDSASLRLPNRRGRVLARKGKVKNLAVRPGVFTAEVASDSGGVLNVSVRMEMIDEEVWELAMDRAAAEAALTADLLRGQVTGRVCALFQDCGHDLFPFDLQDLSVFCTCRESSLICTHGIATIVDFARTLAADSMLLLEFRGRSRDWVLGQIRARRDSGGGEAGEEASSYELSEDPLDDAEGLLDGFFERGVIPHLAYRVERTERKDDDALPILLALGPGPVETPPEEVVRVLAPLMRTARRKIDAIIDQAESTATAPIIAPDPVEAQSLDDLLVAAAHQHGSLTSGQVAKALGIKPREARQYLKWLVEEKRLRQIGRARGTKYVPWDSPEVDEAEGVAAGGT